MIIESHEKIKYSWEEIDRAISEYQLGSIGLEPIVNSLDSYKPKTKEEMALVDNCRKKIFDKTVSRIVDSKEAYPVTAEIALSELDDFASKYGFEIPREVNDSRDSIYRMTREHWLSKLNPNSTSTFCESEIMRLSNYLGDFSVVKDILLNDVESDLADTNQKEALELFVERTEFEKLVHAAKLNGYTDIKKYDELLSGVKKEAKRFLEDGLAKGSKKKDII